MPNQPTFNFSKLAPLYSEAIKRNEPTLAFGVNNGVGRFVFMMFFAQEDGEDKEEYKDKLFVLLVRTRVMIQLKVYGSHKGGDFLIYLTAKHESLIRDELGAHGGNHPFELNRFLEEIHDGFPPTLPLERKIETLRDHKELIEQEPQLRKIVDEASKIYLIGPKRLPEGQHAREKTLRKLYFCMRNTSAQTIAIFINALKNKGYTVAWTDEPREIDIERMIAMLK